MRPLRLAPEMASLRLQVLAFVRSYCTRWGESPSYGEIAQATGTNRTRVKHAVRRLVQTGQLLRQPGPRGLVLPDQQAQALALLERLGWRIDHGGQALRSDGPIVTNPALRLDDVLDYDPGT